MIPILSNLSFLSLKYVQAGLVAGALAFSAWGGWEWRDRAADAELAAEKYAHALAVAAGAAEANRLHTDYRAKEQEMQRATDNLSDTLHYQLMQTETEYALALADARTDAGRLRVENARCAANLSRATRDTTPSGSNDGTASGGVIPESGADVDILTIARDADLVASRLIACQAYATTVEKALGR